MKRLSLLLVVPALAMQLASVPARAQQMTDDQKVAAALTILGIAALAHGKQHYSDGYRANSANAMAEFERGYRDGVHGYRYNTSGSTPDYSEGFRAGQRERENSVAHRDIAPADRAPYMATRGCTRVVARNFDVNMERVHIVKSRSPRNHEWLIETAVGRNHMVCKMRDTGEVIEVRGGKL